ncbi:MAG TPA: S9 family peptidase [Candidatus Eisenbacteria bacterium]|nr:S9 family peptidase [Candidatus Eisenbacteria bacterium]
MTRAWAALALAASIAAAPCAHAANGAVTPTLEQIVALERVGSPALSPDGRFVAYTVRDTDWVGNAFVTQIWLADVASGENRQITQGRKTSNAPAWSPDGRRLAFGSERTDKRQVFVLDMSGGDAVQLTSADEGVTGFAWSPDGNAVAYLARDPKPKALKDREQQDGEIEWAGEDHRMSHLWTIDVASKSARQVTRGSFTVGGFDWSPEGGRIAFEHQADPSLGADSTADISVVTLADGEVRPLVTQPGPDTDPVWSPDGGRVAFQTTMGARWFYYANTMIAAVPAAGGAPEPLTADFDEDCGLIDWAADGIYFAASHRTGSGLHRLDPATRRVTRLAPNEAWVGSAFSFDREFRNVAFVAGDPRHYPEIGVAPLATMAPRTLTDMGRQLAGWKLGTTEVIRWTSRDGAEIEGVLRKPADFRPGRRHPLIVVIHGGPTGVSRPTLFASTYVYPIELWLAKGALVLEPNYRGSAGYGAAFRALNARNLGVGDAWDVVSGIEALVRRGLVDSTRVGACGWSQGGYISAFLATHESRRFRALSVGAGISDWMTYYVNTDITPFTRHYLHATPWSDPDIYARTSPITNVREASAPTLIQHGDADARVPAPNATELYRALKDTGVETRLALFKGFGHSLNKPKAVRAALRQNFEWFDRYLWGGEGAASRGVPAASRAENGGNLTP